MHAAGGPDLRAADAQRPDRPPEPAARRAGAGRPVGGGRRRAGLHPRRPDGLRDAAGADRRGDPHDRRGVRRRRPQRGRGRASTAWSCTAPTATSSTSSWPPTPTCRTDDWGGSTEGRIRFAVEVATGGRRGGRRAPRRPAASPPATPSTASTSPTPDDSTPPCSGRRTARTWPICTCATARDRELTPRLRKNFTGTFLLNPVTDGGRPPAPRTLGADRGRQRRHDRLRARCSSPTPTCPGGSRAGGPFNAPDRASFYGGDDTGYPTTRRWTPERPAAGRAGRPVRAPRPSGRRTHESAAAAQTLLCGSRATRASPRLLHRREVPGADELRAPDRRRERLHRRRCPRC